MPQISPQRRAQQFSCRGSRKRLLRWSAATIRHWKSVRVAVCAWAKWSIYMRALDPARMYVNLDAYKPVARLFANLYAPLGKPFTLVRQTYAEWFASNGVKRG